MPKVTILEDGKPMTTEQVAILGLDTIVLKDDEQVILIPNKPIAETDREHMTEACQRFSSGETRFLLLPHGFKVAIFKKEE